MFAAQAGASSVRPPTPGMAGAGNINTMTGLPMGRAIPPNLVQGTIASLPSSLMPSVRMMPGTSQNRQLAASAYGPKPPADPRTVADIYDAVGISPNGPRPVAPMPRIADTLRTPAPPLDPIARTIGNAVTQATGIGTMPQAPGSPAPWFRPPQMPGLSPSSTPITSPASVGSAITAGAAGVQPTWWRPQAAAPVAPPFAPMPMPPLTRAPSPQQAYSSGGGHRINPGDTLSGISAKTGIPIAQLVAYNSISDPNRITAGQTLRLSPPVPMPRTAMPTQYAPVPMAMNDAVRNARGGFVADTTSPLAAKRAAAGASTVKVPDAKESRGKGNEPAALAMLKKHQAEAENARRFKAAGLTTAKVK